MKKYRITGLLLFFCCCISQGFALENTMREVNDQVIEQLIATNDSCITAIENEKEVYFNSTKIIPHENGLFLQTQEGEYVRIPLLLSSEKGCFTVLSKALEEGVIYPIIKCKFCGKSFNPNIFNKGVCPHCKMQN